VKGFAGLLVLAAFAIVVFGQASLLTKQQEQYSAQAQHTALALIKARSISQDVRTSLAIVLEKAGQDETDPRKKLLIAAAALAQWERQIEAKYASQGVELDAWAGFPQQAEAPALAQAMLAEGKPKKCSLCADLSSPAEDTQGNTVPFALSTIILDNGKTAISSQGLANIQPLEGIATAGKLSIGASVLLPEERMAFTAAQEEQ